MAAALILVTAANSEKTMASTNRQRLTADIKHVTVFTTGAQVERSHAMNLTAGEHVITFTGLSPYIDVKSMQIKARGKLTVLGVNYRTTHPDSLQRVNQLREAERQVKQFADKERELQAQLEVVNAQLEMVKTNSSVGNRTAVTPLVNIKELNNYYAQETLELKKKAIAIDEELAILAEKREKQEKTVDSIAHLKLKSTTEADLTLQVPQAGKVEFDLTYYVKNAGWYPTYDLRSEGLGQPLQLSYKANVFQNTKEEWINIPVTLSSANPSRSNIAPELRTYWLDFGKQAPRYDSETISDGSVTGVVLDENGDPLIGCSVLVVGTSLGTVTGYDGRYSITMPRDKKQLQFSYVGYLSQTQRVNGSTLNVRMKEDTSTLDEVTVIGYGVSKRNSNKMSRKAKDSAPMAEAMAGAIATPYESPKLQESELIPVKEQKAQFGYEFEIRQPLTLSSDGKTTTTEIARYQLPATYQYLGIPRADKDAFLVADATDWQQHSLLEGEANVYFENSFIGKTILDPTVANDTLHFSLGRDNGIRIQRTKVSARSSRRLLASTQEQNMTWRITVKNSRMEAVSLTLQDQIPVSENSNITVTTEELSGGQLDKSTGIVVWQLQLQPNEQREFIVNYRVKYPKNRRLDVE
ncbi:MAG: mucoidy inhibitor MuiA family protein [Prevotella sp.]|nr:mucoidy inhibitor MuiA family protein [Prevotella sp.]